MTNAPIEAMPTSRPLPHLCLALLLVVACTSNDGATTDALGTSGSSSPSSSTGDPTPTTGTSTTASTTATTALDPTTDPTTGGVQDTGSTGSAGSTGSTGDTDTTTGDTTTGDTGDTGDTTTGGDLDVYDPDLDGPWKISEVKGSFMVNGVKVPMDAFYPTDGPEDGPYPVVVVAHGFQLPASQYTGYVKRLASHGYVALTADFQAGLFNPDHVAYAKQALGGIDWVAQEPVLMGIADTNNVGLTGHSLGGKISVLGAILDNRVRASITLDPVDSAVMCDDIKCPDVSNMLPADIPLGFLGETLDGMGGFMPCAPMPDNFLTFYAKAAAPALAVTVKGANHMSFLDDTASCGFPCSFCNAPTLDNAVVNALSRAYVVAFYGRYLKDNPGYDTYLTGAAAKQRYVDMNLIAIQSK